MVMHMMDIWHMSVHMPDRLVFMTMTVTADKYWVVNMGVMAIIVPMGVLMLQDFVGVLMPMGLGQVQHHTGQHQRAAQGHHAAR